jgi:hypothetical protein
MNRPLLASLTILAAPLHAATITHLWNFEAPDAFDDKVGTAHGTAGASVTTAAGFSGGTAAVFPATVGSAAQFVEIDETNITSMVNTGFSVTFWFKIANDGSTTANRGFFDFSGNGGDTGIQGLFRGSDGALNFRIDGSGAPNSVIAFTTIPVEDDAWHHLALTFERGLADGFKLYVDGSFATASSTTTFLESTIVGPNANSYLGTFNFTGASEAKGLNGALDEFGVWSGVLSPAEVSALAAVPEPGVALLGSLGLLTLLRRRR